MSEKILEILRGINPYEDIDEESRLIEDGIIDSLSLVALINEIEETYDIKIPDDKMQPELFDNVRIIVELINELL